MPNSNEYMRHYMAMRRQERRQRLIDLAGGVCRRCGSKEALEFDHIRSETRAFRLSGQGAGMRASDLYR